RIQPPKRYHSILAPHGEGHILWRHDRNLVEDEGRGLGAIANHRIALLEHPAVEPGRHERPFMNRRVGDQPLQSSAGQEEDRPGRVCWRCVLEVLTIADTLALVDWVLLMAS